jgi:iron(III) transport system substrate-binding protein
MTSKLFTAATLGALLACAAPAVAETVNVYTTREKKLLEPALDAFTKSAGIQVNTISIEKGLEERLKAEGASSPADVVIMVDSGRMIAAANDGLFQPVRSEILAGAVPAQLRDADGKWFALTMRSRIVYASKARVAENAISYEDLADPKWKGKVCIRSGQHPYNNALFAAMIAKLGPAEAEKVIAGIKANLAKKPSGGDRDVAKDIAAGVCDVGLANTYYLGLMAANEKEKPWADAVKPMKTSFRGGATMVNMSAGAVASHAPNKSGAIKLLEYMVGPEAQAIYGGLNFEYPVRAGGDAAETVKLFGPVHPDSVKLSDVAANQKAASQLVDRIGFDN